MDNWKKEFINGANIDPQKSFPFVVLVNKCDVEASERKISIDSVKEWCEKNGSIPYFETSAKTGVNVEKAFMQVASIAVKSLAEVSEFVTFNFYSHNN